MAITRSTAQRIGSFPKTRTEQGDAACEREQDQAQANDRGPMQRIAVGNVRLGAAEFAGERLARFE
jgi:hypothetical protein